MSAFFSERLVRRVLAVVALGGLVLGLVAWFVGRSDWASWCWAGGTIPVVVGLLASMVRDFLAGRVGVDAVAFVSMSGAFVLGQNLAGIVIAVMYAGGNILEDFANRNRLPSDRGLVDHSCWARDDAVNRNWPGAVRSMQEMLSKSALLRWRTRVHTQGLSEWLAPRRRRRRPLFDWQTDTRCCCCRSPF